MQNKHKIITSTLVCCAMIFTLSLITDALAAESPTTPEDKVSVHLADVENLVGVASNESVALTWDTVANANLYTVYYGTTSVESAGGLYESKTTSQTNSFVVKNLIADKPYYFAVAAEDTKGIYLGSQNYSNEIKVIPLAIPVSSETITVVEEPKVIPQEAETTQETETTLPAAPAPAPTLSSVAAVPVVTTPVATTTPPVVTIETPEEKLPQSGPVSNLLFGFSIVAGILWSQRKRLWVIE